MYLFHPSGRHSEWDVWCGFSSYVDIVLEILIQKLIIPAGVLVMAKYVLAALEMSCPWGFSFGFRTNIKYFS